MNDEWITDNDECGIGNDEYGFAPLSHSLSYFIKSAARKRYLIHNS